MNSTQTQTQKIPIKKKKTVVSVRPLPEEDTEPERSPTPPPPKTDEDTRVQSLMKDFNINEEMVKFFANSPDGDFASPEKQRELAQFVAKASKKVKTGTLVAKGKTKAEIKGYASTEEAEALGYFNKGDTCPDCGKIFNRKFFKAYHWISKDEQRCDGVIKRSNGKKQGAVRPKVVAKATNWVAEWSEQAVEFGLLDEPLDFTEIDIKKLILTDEPVEAMTDAIKIKPFRKKLGTFLKNTEVYTTNIISCDGEDYVREETKKTLLELALSRSCGLKPYITEGEVAEWWESRETW